jgi:hypothetical protein
VLHVLQVKQGLLLNVDAVPREAEQDLIILMTHPNPRKRLDTAGVRAHVVYQDRLFTGCYLVKIYMALGQILQNPPGNLAEKDAVKDLRAELDQLTDILASTTEAIEVGSMGSVDFEALQC